MLEKTDFKIIDCYVKGLADPKEISYVESLFLNGEKNFTLQKCLSKDWDQLLRNEEMAEVKLNQILDKVHHLIQKNDSLNRKKTFKRILRIYARVAAVLLLPLILVGVLVFSFRGEKDKVVAEKQVSYSVFAPLGSRVSFSLPEGTTGMLNSGARITYSLPFKGKRKLELEGEAWFEVAHDDAHPFVISLGNSKVKVLGTSFNVSAYPSENYVEIVLKKGKVEFEYSKGEKEVTLTPSERLIYKNGSISRSIVDPEKYNSWTEGKLVFRGDKMLEVARRIERWYNVEVRIADRELEKYSFRATFEDDKLEDVLHYLCLTSPIRFEITPHEQLPDGSFKKELVTIYKVNR